MKIIYTTPFRVYLLLGILAVVGIIAGTQLPISLYPNSSKPTIRASISYGSSNAEEFLDNYGRSIEAQLETISTRDVKVEKVTAMYNKTGVYYKIEFEWGSMPKVALKEVESVMNSISSRWPKEVRDSLRVFFWAKSSGFIAISFYSENRDVGEIYDILDPILSPGIAKIDDIGEGGLYNPSKQSVLIELRPKLMASLGLFPRDIKKSIDASKYSFIGGNISVGPDNLLIQMPNGLKTIDKLKEVMVQTPSGEKVTIDKVANVEISSSGKNNRLFKTNGASSLILIAKPRSGGNVKRMAESVLDLVKTKSKSWPADIKQKVLVDPSEFIRESVTNVLHEVFVAAGLAVLVLFLFMGSLKNTITAAIEIPLSMVLAFIMMKFVGMNINLISLGGLALSAGMNVDASVVVMENIFRHMEEHKGPINFEKKIELITNAVKEVSMPVIGATIASLVVFIPLAFTSELTNAILGDLAKAVVFSHGFSAFVALILVPTIRLHIMGKAEGLEKNSKSPIEGVIKVVESTYSKFLLIFINSKKIKVTVLVVALLALTILAKFVVPNLKQEIVGTPDTDWMILSINSSGNTAIKQMEETTAEHEDRLLKMFGDKVLYTFVQINQANNSVIMARLKKKSDMDSVWKGMQSKFVNTPLINYWVGPWNPAELPIPDPDDLEVEIKGGSIEERNLVARNLMYKLNTADVFSNMWIEPSASVEDEITITPYEFLWHNLRKSGVNITPFDLIDLTRVATDGKSIGETVFNGKSMDVFLQYPGQYINSMEDIKAIPIKMGDKIVPLSALAEVKLSKKAPETYRRNGRSYIKIRGRSMKGQEGSVDSKLVLANKVISKFKNSYVKDLKLKTVPVVEINDSKTELTSALKQLGVAIAMSVLLICLVLIFQFGSLIQTGIVLTAIPFGLMGVGISLWVFNSTLSLNSALGVILLNGIAVANSIILVDFIKQKVEKGIAPTEAAITAATTRLRPILITSLTTILGMIPIALGLGDGGKILQPLGLAVSGGLWFSMLFTLFVVPALEVLYFNWRLRFDEKLIFASEQRRENMILNDSLISNKTDLNHGHVYMPDRNAQENLQQ